MVGKLLYTVNRQLKPEGTVARARILAMRL